MFQGYDRAKEAADSVITEGAANMQTAQTTGTYVAEHLVLSGETRTGNVPISDFKESESSPVSEDPMIQPTDCEGCSKDLDSMNDTGKEKEDRKMTSRKEGLFTVFETGETTYRIGGIKTLFVTSLRVNIKAGNGKTSYYDSIDLYASRGRASFAQGLYRTWGMSPERVEKDLVEILEFLEKERDERLLGRSSPVDTELTEKERILGLKLLKDRNIFDRIVEDMSAMGYVGEDLNKILLYLCASSRKLDDPISVLIVSQSASGKRYLVDTVRCLMPPEDVVAVTSLSDQALNYIDNLMHKFLILGESVHSDAVEYQIREMLSGKELSRLVTVKDPETGKLTSQVVRTPVVVSSVMSGTGDAINPENASRCFVVNADESPEQTKKIHESQRLKYSLERLKHGNEEKERIIRTHRAAQKLLRKVNIVNDFAPLLDFPFKLMRTRRDNERFMDLIACVCFLRQYQKVEEEEDGIRFIRCDLEDYEVAYRIMVEGVLSGTMRELPSGVQILYEQMRKYAKDEAVRQKLDPTGITMTQRQVREYTGQSQAVVKSGIRQLVEYEYINVVKGGGERIKGFYRIRLDEEMRKADFSMIPTPLEMKESLRIRYHM